MAIHFISKKGGCQIKFLVVPLLLFDFGKSFRDTSFTGNFQTFSLYSNFGFPGSHGLFAETLSKMGENTGRELLTTTPILIL